EEILIERPPIHTDANRLSVVDSDLDDGSKVFITPFSADISWVDAVLRECARALGILGKQKMAVVVKVPDDRDITAVVGRTANDFGKRGCRLIVVDSHAHEL